MYCSFALMHCSCPMNGAPSAGKKKKKPLSHAQSLCDEASIEYDTKFGLYVKNE